jgi:hypothetical protein
VANHFSKLQALSSKPEFQFFLNKTSTLVKQSLKICTLVKQSQSFCGNESYLVGYPGRSKYDERGVSAAKALATLLPIAALPCRMRQRRIGMAKEKKMR